MAGLLPFGAWAKENNFEGTITVREENGGAPTAFLYTRKGDLLRIETLEAKTPVPINVLNLAQQKLTIIYPHNRTFVHVDLIPPLRDRTQAGAPNPNSVGGTAGSPGTTASSPTVQKMSPPPGFPTPPPMPSMPPMPNNAMASGMPSMPTMPPMGGFGGTPELKKTDKTKKIQGFDCTLYTISDRMETFEIWATHDSTLFPFRLLQTDSLNRRFGPRMLEEQWIELLQKQSLFPFEATLRMNLYPRPAGPAANGGKGNDPGSAKQGQERLSFKVDKIDQQKIDNAEELFSPPKNYIEMRAPQFLE